MNTPSRLFLLFAFTHFFFSAIGQINLDSFQIIRADKLLDQAIEIKNNGETDSAIYMLEKVLLILDSIPEPQYGISADTYRQLGFLYKRKRNARKTIYNFDRGIQSYRYDLFPDAAEDWIDVHNQIGVQYGMQYKLDSANLYFLAGIDSARVWDVEYTSPTMAAFNNLIFSSSIAGKRRQSIEYSKESLRISKGMSGDPADIAQGYAGLAIGFIENQAPGLGKIYVDSSQVYVNQIEEPDLRNRHNCTNMGYMARIKFDSDEVHAARAYAIKALAYADSLKDFNTSGRAYALTFLGKSQSSLGDVQSAIHSLESAKQIYTHLERGSDAAALDNIIGSTWSQMGMYDEALENYKKSLKTYQAVNPKNGQKAGIVYMNMGRIAARTGNDEKASLLYDTAFSFFNFDTTLNREYIRDTWLSYGYLQMNRDALAKAKVSFTEVLRRSNPEISGDDQSIRSLIGLAKVARKENDFSSSDSILRHAIKLIGFHDVNDILEIEYPQLALDILENLGQTSYEAYKQHHNQDEDAKARLAMKQSLSYYLQAKEGLHLVEGEFMEDISRLHSYEDHHKIYFKLIELYNEKLLESDQEQSAWDILAICEENQKSLLAENIWMRERSLQSPELGERILEKALLIKEISDARNDLKQAEKEKKEQSEIDMLSGRLYDLVQEKISVQTKIDSSKSSLHQLDMEEWTGRDLQKWSSSLEETTRLLYYFTGYGEAYAFCIGPDQIQVEKVDSFSQVRDAIGTIHRQLHDLDDTASNLAIDLLSRSLLHPFENMLSGADKLILIPGGDLSTLPFEILNNPIDHSQMLLESFDISYAGSVKLLDFQSKQKRSFKNRFLGMAPLYSSPEIDETDSLLYPTFAILVRSGPIHLPGALKEVQSIAEIMDGDAITGREATKAALGQRAGKYEILHLSMHALLDEKEPLNSKLVFDADETEDSYLSAAELNTMDLDARMVVLSACNSGSGKIFKGEGAQSLSRSFMAAGVPTVVMSLWKVPDASTKEIMIAFYENLVSGMPAHRALREAKLNYLKNAKTDVERNPIYWAGFVLIGNPSPLHSSSWISNPWVIGAGVSILLLLLLWKMMSKKTNSSR